MALDPSIPLGIKPVQIESPINQMAKMYEMQNIVQSNKLNQMKMDEYTRGVAEDEAIRNYFAQQDRTSPDFVKGLYGISPKTGQAYEKSQEDVRKERALTKSAELDQITKVHGLVKTGASQVLADPRQATARSVIQQIARQTGADMSAEFARLDAIGENPVEITRWATGHALDADKQLEQHYVNQENVMVKGVPTTQVLQMPKYGTGAAATVKGSAAPTYNKPAGNTVFNLPDTTAKKYGEVFSAKAAESDIAMRDAALTAPKQAENANNILTALNSGQLYLGAGADVKLGLARFLNMAGKDDNEKVANTQILMQGQSQATLNAIKSAGLGTSQGFTDKDLVFLKGIAGGTIALDATTIRKLAELQHRAATESVKKWTTRRSSIPKGALEGTGIDQEAYEVPPMIQPPKGKPAAGAPSAPAKTRSGATTSNW